MSLKLAGMQREDPAMMLKLAPGVYARLHKAPDVTSSWPTNATEMWFLLASPRQMVRLVEGGLLPLLALTLGLSFLVFVPRHPNVRYLVCLLHLHLFCVAFLSEFDLFVFFFWLT